MVGQYGGAGGPHPAPPYALPPYFVRGLVAPHPPHPPHPAHPPHPHPAHAAHPAPLAVNVSNGREPELISMVGIVFSNAYTRNDFSNRLFVSVARLAAQNVLCIAI